MRHDSTLKPTRDRLYCCSTDPYSYMKAQRFTVSRIICCLSWILLLFARYSCQFSCKRRASHIRLSPPHKTSSNRFHIYISPFCPISSSTMRIKSLIFMSSASEILHRVSTLALVRPLSISARWLRDTAARPESTSCVSPRCSRSFRMIRPVMKWLYCIDIAPLMAVGISLHIGACFLCEVAATFFRPCWNAVPYRG